MRVLCRSIAAVLLSLSVFFLPVQAGQPLDEDTAHKVEAFDNIVNEFTNPSYSTTSDHYASRGERLNQAFVALTGEAVNPLFGITMLGVYKYITTDAAYRPYLPAYYRPEVWIPLLIIIALMLFNSTIAEAMPFLKTPLNALGDVVNKAGAIVVLPLVVKMFADTVAGPIGQEIAQASNTLFPAAFAADSLLSAGAVWSILGWIAGAAVGTIIYLAVWLTFNMVDVLILLCPFPGVDALLKSFRLAVIGAIMGAREVSPTIAFFLAATIVVISFFMAGWSFRLSIFGWITSTDLLFFRRKSVENEPVSAFSGELAPLPMRTLGRLQRKENGELLFSYRPWLILPRRTLALGSPDKFACGRGLLNPFLVSGSNPDAPWLRLPPRYRGQEQAMAGHFGLPRIVDCGFSGAFRSWLASVFRRRPAAS